MSNSAPSPVLSIQTISVTRPRAILSLSGTLGDNGWYISDVKCSLYISGDDSESLTIEYAFYNGEWATYSDPCNIFEEGQTAIYYRVRNATGFVWETTVATVDIDKTPPYGSVLIEGGAEEAFSTVVNLVLSVTDAPSGPTTPPPPGYIWGVPSGPADMRFSNDGVFWSLWESFAINKSWTLETGAGTKTVYVQARDNAGLVSEIFSGTISLVTAGDVIPPVTKITVSGKQSAGAYTSTVAITLSAIDDLSGIGLTEYSFDANTWTTYATPFTISAEGQITVYYRSHDLAGNVESTNSQTINIDKIKESNSTIHPFVVYTALAAVAMGVFVIVFAGRKQRKSKELFDQ
ncbi:MAG: OmpL47-type beta-barrel domain-containing protein, partial [Promethearchaeota archaeon]